MSYGNTHCEDEDDAARFAEWIRRDINEQDVSVPHTKKQLIKIAQYAERIARWARKEAQLRT